MTTILKIATRRSPLALWQAEFVASALTKHHPKLSVELIKITTTGDQMLDTPLAQIGGKALFIKELEKAMLDGRADMAVHSMKDVPFELPDGFEIGAILKRHSPFDALVSNQYQCLDELPKGALIGSCSLRRMVQLKQIRTDVNFADLRGNVNTRLNKLDAGQYDAIILACAGLERLGLGERICQRLSIEQSLPAVGQGAIGIEIKQGDERVKSLLTPIADENSSLCVNAERAMNQKLQGSCQAAIAGFAVLDNNKLTLSGLVGDVNTQRVLKHTVSGNEDQGQQLGESLADVLLALGAGEMLKG